MGSKKHALLSASSSQKWLNNPKIARLEEIATEEYRVDDSNVYAEKGTIAHALAEAKLQSALGKQVSTPKSSYIDEDMEMYTDDYVQFVQERIYQFKHKPLVLIEQRLDFTEYAPEGFGTVDCVLVGDGTIQVIDFKYGKGYVKTENNTQMMLYALGAIQMFDGIYDIQEIYMTIYQPRIGNIDTWVIDKEALLDWANGELKEKAQLAYEGKGDFEPGPWLRLTKLRAISKDRAIQLLMLQKYELKKAHLLTDAEITEILPKLDDLIDWAKSLKEYAEQQAIDHQKQWPGFKLVEGRTTRKYMDVALVEQRANEKGIQDIHEVKLKALTKLEKQIGNKKFNEIFGDLIMRSAGKIQLVPDSDGRPAIVRHDVKEDFK
ncbi:DUF2800 domain-containing protein [Jeotgalibaca dankookensis]|uniref:DUF2800 domain-containing protein n=1 Tax=Jeotgalibaca dankookensis TaxID=708126 RepID=UPI00078485F0|nr:DUF2800 domain-containing protein [Jeotgalibaca dankookensis]